MEVGGLIATAARDAVETLCITAGIIINLQHSIATKVQRVADLSNLHFGQDRFLGFEMLVRQFKAVVPQSVFGRTQLLNFFPLENTHFIALAAFDAFKDYAAHLRHIRMALRCVADHHCVPTG